MEHEIIMKSREELGQDIGNAYTIGAYNIPIDPTYIGSIDTGKDTFHYYRDVDGRVYFKSENVECFDQKMEEAKKRRRQKIKKYSRRVLEKKEATG